MTMAAGATISNTQSVGDQATIFSQMPVTAKSESFEKTDNSNSTMQGDDLSVNNSENQPNLKDMFDRVIEKIKQDYDLSSVLRSHGIDLKRASGGYMVANCPFPNHADSSPSFKVKTSGGETYTCYGCQAKGDVLDFIRDYHHLTGVTEAIKYLTGKNVKQLYEEINKGRSIINSNPAYKTVTKTVVAEPVKTKEQIESELANATDAYIGLISLLKIDPQHVEQLRQRGISESEAMLLGYRSFPTDRNLRIKICKSLRQAGYELKGVPGFFRLPKREFSKGQWCFGGDRWGFRDIKTDAGIFKVTGLLIPTRDLDGKIRRLKVRNDAPDKDVPEETARKFPERYMAFSSAERDDGAGAGAWVHVARPIYKKASAKNAILWITEGEIKADISALYLGETVLGMPGVGQCPQFAIDAALSGGFDEICVAMDAEEKPHVKLAIAKLIKLAKENSLEVSVAVWEESLGKGLDDLLAGGGAPEVFTPENWWQRLSTEHKTYVTERITGRGAVK